MNLNHISSFCVEKFTFSARKQTQGLRVTQLWVLFSLVAQWLRIHLPTQGHGLNPWSKISHDEEQLSPCTSTTEHAHCKYWSRRTYSLRSTREACTPQRRAAPARWNYRRPMDSNEDPVQPKVNKWTRLKKKKKKKATWPYLIAGKGLHIPSQDA